jgi:hypothetical protein
MLYFIIASIGLILLHKFDDDYRRLVKYSTGVHHFVLKHPIVTMSPIYLWGGIVFRDEFEKIIFTLDRHELLIGSAQSLLMAVYIVLVYWLTRIILRWRAPELAFVRALADAFEIIVAVRRPATLIRPQLR